MMGHSQVGVENTRPCQVIKPRKVYIMNKRKKGKISVDCLEFNKEILHSACHPKDVIHGRHQQPLLEPLKTLMRRTITRISAFPLFFLLPNLKDLYQYQIPCMNVKLTDIDYVQMIMIETQAVLLKHIL